MVAIFISGGNHRGVWGIVGDAPADRQGAVRRDAAFLHRNLVPDIAAGALADALLVRVGSLAILWLHERDRVNGGGDHNGLRDFWKKKSVPQTGVLWSAVADTGRADMATIQDVCRH